MNEQDRLVEDDGHSDAADDSQLGRTAQAQPTTHDPESPAAPATACTAAPSAEEVGHQSSAPAVQNTADDEWHYLCERRIELRIHVLTNRLYQQERQRIFEHREGLVKVVSLVAGSVAFVKVANADWLQTSSGLLVIATSAALVFGWGAKARDAAKRSADWTGLDRDIARTGERRFTEEDLDEWNARCCEVESTEPAPNQVLLEQSYRRACAALDRKPESSNAPWGFRWRVPVLIA